ncbi:unnamed protein product [Prorocentrum cordatum]|uniref:DUF3035 domain-containing protein n=1 Tax=Prorocentrum cordatum TaxID=2364126 RepID=A0ABN9RDC9_9DINO|nr:unnamed protein product [Polarella glacialis]|mmetsp:Transcript_43151/g.116018  ORF Transcript_43151/g.116018 Transcript_43151/m.116018 type:complete len:211 (+) Transcript_43151:104-736(+)
MVHSGALLPVALAALSGCRALDVQKFGTERIEKFAALRAESESLRAEIGAERALTRARADMVGTLDMFQEPAEEEVATSARSRTPEASPARTLPGIAAEGTTSPSFSLAEMKKILEDKIATIAAREAEREAKAEGAPEADSIEEIVALARQAGQARLEEAKRIARESADRWEMTHPRQGNRRGGKDAKAKDAIVEGEATEPGEGLALMAL